MDILRTVKQSNIKIRQRLSRQASELTDTNIENHTRKETQNVKDSSSVTRGNELTNTPLKISFLGRGYVLELQKRLAVKEKEKERKEADVTTMVGIILTTFLVCTLPAAIMLELDPEADIFPQVLNDPYSNKDTISILCVSQIIFCKSMLTFVGSHSSIHP